MPYISPHDNLTDRHMRQVAAIAGDLFDACAKLHGLGPKEGRLLRAAALLHDIGWVDGQQQHHKRSMEMIYSDPPKGLSPREVAIVANVARYHRKTVPKESHLRFAALSERDRGIVLRLAALIRVADGLDRTHGSLVRVLGCDVSGDRAIIRLSCLGDCSEELAEATDKGDLFENVFGKTVTFVR